jgi:hypothetical protein
MVYLLRCELLEDEVESRQIDRPAKAFTIINNKLYKRITSGVFLRCISPEEGRKILNDIHSGECSHHAGSRTLVAKALRHGFFWLIAHAYAKDIMRKCVSCQKFEHQLHLPGSAPKTIPLTWPFAI